MKALSLLSLTVLVFISSTSNAFCIKQYMAQKNRFILNTAADTSNDYNNKKVAQAGAGTTASVSKNK